MEFASDNDLTPVGGQGTPPHPRNAEICIVLWRTAIFAVRHAILSAAEAALQIVFQSERAECDDRNAAEGTQRL